MNVAQVSATWLCGSEVRRGIWDKLQSVRPGSNPGLGISFQEIIVKPKMALQAKPYDVGRWGRYPWIALGKDYLTASIIYHS